MEARLSKPDPERFQLSLRIRHPSMDPADISRTLKIEAEHSSRAGGPRTSSTGNSFTLAPEASQLFGDLGIAVEFELASE
jgi:hypothetical protein